jgi:hypothetical protein
MRTSLPPGHLSCSCTSVCPARLCFSGGDSPVASAPACHSLCVLPAGVYNQLWDWDSVTVGVGLLQFGSAPYFAGSMLNFLDWVGSRCVAPHPSPEPAGVTMCRLHG